MATATWIKDLLQQEGVEFEELHHTEAFTAQAVARQEHVSGHHVAKVVLVMADGHPVELVLPASRRIVLERVRDILGARDVRLATEPEMNATVSDCEAGALPALRYRRDAEVLMDEAMRVPGDIVFQAGTHCDAVRMHFADWFRMTKPRVGSFSEPVTAQHGTGT